MEGSASSPSIAVLGGPERLFGIEDVARMNGGAFTAVMPVGTATMVGGVPQVAALGVLIDDALGYAVNDHSEGWSVSTELSLDMTGRMPSAGDLTCTARVVHRDVTSALAVGEVSAETGVVARCSLRGRFSDTGRSSLATPGLLPDLPHMDRGGLDALLGIEEHGTAGSFTLDLDARHLNPMGRLHGGVHFVLAERAAARAVPQLPETMSVRLQLVRGVSDGGQVNVSSEVLHHGRTMAVVVVRAHDQRGRLVNLATVVRHATAEEKSPVGTTAGC
jgi:uncharacterized protein (TIGR00369 family)